MPHLSSLHDGGHLGGQLAVLGLQLRKGLPALIVQAGSILGHDQLLYGGQLLGQLLPLAGQGAVLLL